LKLGFIQKEAINSILQIFIESFLGPPNSARGCRAVPPKLQCAEITGDFLIREVKARIWFICISKNAPGNTEAVSLEPLWVALLWESVRHFQSFGGCYWNTFKLENKTTNVIRPSITSPQMHSSNIKQQCCSADNGDTLGLNISD
jgi:hypothetical protein